MPHAELTMKRRVVACGLALIIAALLLGVAKDPGSEASSDAPTVLVHFALPADAGTASARAAAIAERQERILADAGVPPDAVVHLYGAVPGFAVRATPALAAQLSAHSLVLSVAPDRDLHVELNETAALINATEPRDIWGVTGAGVTVAVLDTGIDTDHPDLSDDIAFEKCYSAVSTCNGSTSASGPGVAEDGHGHGTGVSGVITGKGTVAPKGIAPDADLAVYRILESNGSGSAANLVAALDDILANHPEVKAVNMSVSDGAQHAGACDGFEPLTTAAVDGLYAAGTVSFAASGNQGYTAGIAWPACIGNVISTGAVWDATLPTVTHGGCTQTPAPADEVACFSNSGTELDILAPGAFLTHTALGGGSTTSGGTSQASPVAAGVAAMLWEIDPSITAAGMEGIIESTGNPRTDFRNSLIRPRVDAKAAITSITDPDGDGVSSYIDNCPFDFNPGQENTDAAPLDNGPNLTGDDITILNGDALGDACDADKDNDGISDADELTGAACGGIITDPLKMDTDGDHVTDGWECANGTDPTDPSDKPFTASLPDSDGDRIPDHWELRGYNGNTSSTDTDGDGCHDMVELASIDDDKFITITDRLAVARRSLNIWGPDPAQDYVLDLDKDGNVGIADRLFVARAQLLADWQPKSCS